MKTAKAMVHALEFVCQAPLRFYEHCASCPRFHDDCPDLALGREILRGKKKVVYNGNARLENEVNVGDFQCLAPLYYFEKSRKNCAHEGRCREEGLLLALLSGKKSLDYSQKEAIQLPVRKEGTKRRGDEEKAQGVLVS
jgi:hypothetical protein